MEPRRTNKIFLSPSANVYIGRINKVLLYSTEKCMQCTVINHNGKNKKKNMYICITESLCCAAAINTTV